MTEGASTRWLPRSASWLRRTSLERPGLVLAAAVLQTLLIAPGLARLELRTDGNALIPPDAPEVAVDAEVRARFGVRDPVAVVLESTGPNGIYEPALLRRIQELSRAFLALDGVGEAHVESLATERSDRVRTGTLDFRPWLDPLPATPEELARLRKDVEEIEIYAGTLVSADRPASAAAILVGLPPGADRQALLREIRAIVRNAHEPSDEERFAVHVVGAPAAEAELGLHLLEDLALLVPLAVLLMFGIFLFAFRSLFAALLPLAEIGAALVTVFALMGWCGVPVYLSSAVLPVILTATAVADELHLLACFVRRRRDAPAAPVRTLVEATLREMSRPVVATSLTTALGFLAFAGSPIAPVRAFGHFMAIGVLYCMGWTLLVTPALLALAPADSFRSVASGARAGWLGWSQARLAALHRGVLARRRFVLTGFLGLLIACSIGIARVEVRDSWVGGFSEGSELRRATRRVDELFAGTHLLQIAVSARETRAEGRVTRDAFGESDVLLPERLDPLGLRWHRFRVRGLDESGLPLETGIELTARILRAEIEEAGTRLHLRPEGGIRSGSLASWLPTAVRSYAYEIDAEGFLAQPEVLEQIGAFESFLGGLEQERVGRAIGPFEHLTTMSFMLRSRRPEQRAIPETSEEVDAVLKHYVRVRGEERLRRLFDPGYRSALVTVFLKQADSVATGRVLSAARRYEREHLEPELLALETAGDAAVSRALVGGIVRTQVLSLLFALPAIVATAGFIFRSLAWGALCAVPALVAVLVDFACLGFAGIPLGVATSMFAGMTIGIGVDYGIHLFLRLKRGLEAGTDPEGVSRTALAEVGPAITLDALALGAAFGLLVFSQVPANVRLGALMVLSLATCLAASLLLAILLPPRPFARGLRRADPRRVL